MGALDGGDVCWVHWMGVMSVGCTGWGWCLLGALDGGDVCYVHWMGVMSVGYTGWR